MIPIFSIQGKGHNDISTIGHIISKYDKKVQGKSHIKQGKGHSNIQKIQGKGHSTIYNKQII